MSGSDSGAGVTTPADADLDVAGLRPVSEGGIEIERAPDGDHLRAARRPHRARLARRRRRQAHRPQRGVWEHGLLVSCPGGSCSTSRCTCGSHTRPRRVDLLAAARGRGAGIALRLIEEYASAAPGLAATRTPSPSSSSGRARSSSTSRSRTSRARRGTSPRTTRASSATPSSTGSPAASARRRGRSGSRTTLPAGAQPHGDRLATSRTVCSTSTTTPSRSTSRRTRPRTSPSRARCATSATLVWRGMIRVEKDAQKTNAYQENRNLLLSKAHADSIPGLEILANDVAARTARRSGGSTASSSSTPWPAASRARMPSG